MDNGQGHGTASGAPHQRSSVTAKRAMRLGRRSGAPSAPWSTDAVITRQDVTSEEERTPEKAPKAKPGRQNDRPHLQSEGPTDPTLASLERLTIARRVDMRESVSRAFPHSGYVLSLRPVAARQRTHLLAYESSRESINQTRYSAPQAEKPEASQHPATILISSTRKPISYINCAKRLLFEHGEVHLSALGVAIGPMVTVAEILKSKQLAVVTKLYTSLEHATADERCTGKSKMDIVLCKAARFDAIIEAEAAERQKAPDIAT